MPIAAFTNEPGAHYRSDAALDSTEFIYPRGVTGRGPPERFKTTTNVTFPSGYCMRSPIQKGYYPLPTRHLRSVAAVVENRPFTTHSDQNMNADGSGELYCRTLYQRHLTNTVDPLSLPIPREAIFQQEENNNRAILKARSKLREGKVQNGVDIVEARKTANAVADDFSKLLRAYKAFRSGLWSQIPGALGADRYSLLSGQFLADRWLAWIYGYKPLFGAVTDNAVLVERILTQSRTFHFSVVGGRDSEAEEAFSREDDLRVELKWKGGARCKINANLSSVFLSGLDTTGMLNPASILWELAPYSFMVDWFANVNGWLDTLSATAGLVYDCGYVSTRQEASAKVAKPIGTDDPGSLVVQSFDFGRNPTSSFPIPALTGGNNPFSTTHVGTSLALFRQLFR